MAEGFLELDADVAVRDLEAFVVPGRSEAGGEVVEAGGQFELTFPAGLVHGADLGVLPFRRGTGEDRDFDLWEGVEGHHERGGHFGLVRLALDLGQLGLSGSLDVLVRGLLRLGEEFPGLGAVAVLVSLAVAVSQVEVDSEVDVVLERLGLDGLLEPPDAAVEVLVAGVFDTVVDHEFVRFDRGRTILAPPEGGQQEGRGRGEHRDDAFHGSLLNLDQ